MIIAVTDNKMVGDGKYITVDSGVLAAKKAGTIIPPLNFRLSKN